MIPVGRMRNLRVLRDSAIEYTVRLLKGRTIRWIASSPNLQKGKWWDRGAPGVPSMTYTRVVVLRPKGSA